MELKNFKGLQEPAWNQHLFVAGDGYRFGVLELPPKGDSFHLIPLLHTNLSVPSLSMKPTYRFSCFYVMFNCQEITALIVYQQNKKNQFLSCWYVWYKHVDLWSLTIHSSIKYKLQYKEPSVTRRELPAQAPNCGLEPDGPEVSICRGVSGIHKSYAF